MVALNNLPELPAELKPYDRSNPFDIVRAIACQVGEANEQGLLNGYEHIDCAFIAFLVEHGIPLEIVQETFRSVFCSEYDEKRTSCMYERTKQRLEANEEIIGAGSFIQTIRDLNLTKIEGLVNLLMHNNGGSTYKKGSKFIPRLLAEELMNEYPLMYLGEQLFIYRNGVYEPTGEEFIRSECRIRLGDDAQTNRINEVVNHICDLRRVPPEETNTHKDELINVKNGMLKWQTGEVLPHDPNYRSTIQIPVEHDPNATCPEIDHFLETTVPKDCINLVFEFIGYCLTTDTRFNRAVMLIGSGANGKSTFLNLLEALLGESNVSSIPLQEIAENRFKRAEFFGKLVNMFADIASRGIQDGSFFKAIVTGDAIDAERKFKRPFKFRPHAKQFFSANTMPKSNDRTKAFYRRWIILPFPNSFEGENADTSLISKLTTSEELSGLFNRALIGLRRLFENEGFTETATTAHALNDYMRDNDSIEAFIQDSCEFGADYEIERGALFAAYESFCEDEGPKPVGRNTFYKTLRNLGNVTEYRAHRGRSFRGIKLREGEDDDLR